MACDRLSSLPDEILVTILSFLPQKTKVYTSALSSRFRNVWKYSEELSIYGDHRNHVAVTDYLNNHLTFYLAPVLRVFKLRLLYDDYRAANITKCLDFVVSRHVENLLISGQFLGFQFDIPLSFFYCNSIRELKIAGNSVCMYVPPKASLPSLQKLEVSDLDFLSTADVQRLLDASSVLVAFSLGLRNIEFEMPYTVYSTSLEHLYIRTGDDVSSIDVKTPSLRSLKFKDRTFNGEGGMNDGRNLLVTFAKMPSLEVARIDVCEIDLTSLMQSITSVTTLSICSSRDLALNDQGVMFAQLQHLKICHCPSCDIDFHILLQSSPNVNVLTIEIINEHGLASTAFNIFHAAPEIHVPDSTLAKLETLIWTDYSHQSPSIECMYYILRNARALRNVYISFREQVLFKYRARNDLLRVERASPTLQLNILFNDVEASESYSQ